ncbi:hypothetical protein AB5I41_15455 [Sphingomonas sp. MMS24-JH45]
MLAYDNARLPEALLRAGLALSDDLIACGLQTLDWIMSKQTAPQGHFRAVGSSSFGREMPSRSPSISSRWRHPRRSMPAPPPTTPPATHVGSRRANKAYSAVPGRQRPRPAARHTQGRRLFRRSDADRAGNRNRGRRIDPGGAANGVLCDFWAFKTGGNSGRTDRAVA